MIPVSNKYFQRIMLYASLPNEINNSDTAQTFPTCFTRNVSTTGYKTT